MTCGIGGSTAERELSKLSSMVDGVAAISPAERQERIARAQQVMGEKGIAALYLDATTSLTYFTGARFHQSERTIGALLPAEGPISYISPAFEAAKLPLTRPGATRLATPSDLGRAGISNPSMSLSPITTKLRYVGHLKA